MANKEQSGNKNKKKEPKSTPQEKKIAKQLKKQGK
jgi:hypothetical protein